MTWIKRLMFLLCLGLLVVTLLHDFGSQRALAEDGIIIVALFVITGLLGWSLLESMKNKK